jgi:hypothetical protein
MSGASSVGVVAKNSPSVTPRASAILCSDPSDGDTWPFSSWEMKLGEKPVCAANARTEMRRSERRRRTCSPSTWGSTGVPMSIGP